MDEGRIEEFPSAVGGGGNKRAPKKRTAATHEIFRK